MKLFFKPQNALLLHKNCFHIPVFIFNLFFNLIYFILFITSYHIYFIPLVLLLLKVLYTTIPISYTVVYNLCSVLLWSLFVFPFPCQSQLRANGTQFYKICKVDHFMDANLMLISPFLIILLWVCSHNTLLVTPGGLKTLMCDSIEQWGNVKIKVLF